MSIFSLKCFLECGSHFIHATLSWFFLALQIDIKDPQCYFSTMFTKIYKKEGEKKKVVHHSEAARAAHARPLFLPVIVDSVAPTPTPLHPDQHLLSNCLLFPCFLLFVIPTSEDLRAPAHRARHVRDEPTVNALRVEDVAAARYDLDGLLVLELGQADDAPPRELLGCLAVGHHGQRRGARGRPLPEQAAGSGPGLAAAVAVAVGEDEEEAEEGRGADEGDGRRIGEVWLVHSLVGVGIGMETGVGLH